MPKGYWFVGFGFFVEFGTTWIQSHALDENLIHSASLDTIFSELIRIKFITSNSGSYSRKPRPTNQTTISFFPIWQIGAF